LPLRRLRYLRGVRRVLHSGGLPPEWVVYDGYTRCPYLAGKTARLPMRLPARPLNRQELAIRLAEGDRRQGLLLYRPSCPGCSACEAIRIPVAEYVLTRTQRRVFRRGESLFRTQIASPSLSDEKVALYNRHKIERGLLISNEILDAMGYYEFLVESCADTIELSYYDKNHLAGAAIVDRATDSLSAVYCYFDPDYARFSPGTYSILKLLTLCREWKLPYLYLGLYVAGCGTMAYKSTFLPHERLIAASNSVFTPRARLAATL
jgi:arginyl-tRNA--protein-N-Asp/Glu arginylyltransferase